MSLETVLFSVMTLLYKSNQQFNFMNYNTTFVSMMCTIICGYNHGMVDYIHIRQQVEFKLVKDRKECFKIQ